MRRYIRVLWLICSVVLVLSLAISLCWVLQAYRERHQAERFLGVLQQIRVGSTDRDAVLRMTEPFRKHTKEWADRGLPALSFAFDNSRLVRLKLAPYTDFRGSITFKNDVVVQKEARVFASGSGCAVAIMEDAHGFGIVDEIEPSNRTDRHVFVSSPGSTPSRIMIYDDNTLGDMQRRADWNLNLLCLTRLGGCSDARLMFGD